MNCYLLYTPYIFFCALLVGAFGSIVITCQKKVISNKNVREKGSNLKLILKASGFYINPKINMEKNTYQYHLLWFSEDEEKESKIVHKCLVKPLLSISLHSLKEQWSLQKYAKKQREKDKQIRRQKDREKERGAEIQKWSQKRKTNRGRKEREKKEKQVQRNFHFTSKYITKEKNNIIK